MKFFTTRFGNLEVNDTDIINFPEGLLGFEDMRKYVVLNMEEGSPLMWMQSLEEPALAFVVIRPFEFNPAYSLEISEKDEEFLKLKKPDDADILAIVVVPEDPSQMTANLQGPVVVNKSNKTARQIISTNPKHKIKHYILKEMEKNIAESRGGD